ncbi:hypothetical protein PHSC3_001985 [Chlamydiales bacterium STE3]|nr:hypothetical protein PHSC3_001985 [Chlamydiales bacterium STE3]
MAILKIIRDAREINLGKEWKDTPGFKSKIVDKQGKTPPVAYCGHYYQLIAQKERKFFLWERLVRGCLGALAIVFSCGGALFSKTVRKLLTKKQQRICFGVLTKKVDPVSLPEEIALKIFSYLDPAHLGRSMQVSKAWQALTSDKTLWKTPPKEAFGKAAWTTYFKEIGEEPPFPKEFYKILKSGCHLYPDKKLEETHVPVLIPEIVDGIPLTLETLPKLASSIRKGNLTLHDNTLGDGKGPAHRAHWVLMTKYSFNGSYHIQNSFDDEVKKTYKLPSVLDAAVCSFVNSLIIYNEETEKEPQCRIFSDEFQRINIFINGHDNFYMLCLENMNNHIRELGVIAFKTP